MQGLVKGDALEAERLRDVLDDVVGTAPVRPRSVQTVQVAGGFEGADDEGGIWVGRSFRQQRSAWTHEGIHLAVATCTAYVQQ